MHFSGFAAWKVKGIDVAPFTAIPEQPKETQDQHLNWAILGTLSQSCLEFIVVLLFAQTALGYQAGLCNNSIFGQRSWDLPAIMFCPWWTVTLCTGRFQHHLPPSSGSFFPGRSLAQLLRHQAGDGRASPSPPAFLLFVEKVSRSRVGCIKPRKMQTFQAGVLNSSFSATSASKNLFSKYFYPKVTVTGSLHYIIQLSPMCTFHFKITLFLKTFYRKGNIRMKY